MKPAISILVSMLVIGAVSRVSAQDVVVVSPQPDVVPPAEYAPSVPSAPPSYAPPVYGQPVYGQPAYGLAAYGQPVYGQPAVLAPAYAQTNYGAYSSVVTLDAATVGHGLERARRGLGIERTGLILAPIGAAFFVAGLATVFSTDIFYCDYTCSLGTGLLIGGWALTRASLLSGAVGGIVASNELRRLGIPGAKRSLAITALVLSLIPALGAGLVAYVLELVHLRKVKHLMSEIRVQPVARRGPSFAIRSFVDPRSGVFGESLTIAF